MDTFGELSRHIHNDVVFILQYLILQVTISCPRGYEFVTGRGAEYEINCALGGHWTDSVISDCQRWFYLRDV